jgi:hypothetical protein
MNATILDTDVLKKLRIVPSINDDNKIQKKIEPYLDTCIIEKNIPHFPSIKPLEHTMCFSLEEYVTQKLPIFLLEQALLENCKIILYGIYPTHFRHVYKKYGYDSVEQVSFIPNDSDKKINYIRPSYFKAYKKNKLLDIVIAVTPGSDYIYHYASFIRFFITQKTKNIENYLKINRFPKLEENICKWTDLGRKFVKKDDIIVLGYSENLCKEINKNPNFRKIASYENSYYISTRYYSKSNKFINLLGVKYSFWGNISSHLVTGLCKLGVKEVHYIAKLGALTKPQDLYNKIYVPDTFYTLHYDQIVNCVKNLKNPLLEYFPELNTGSHVSVPTVLEEDFHQREIITKLKAKSIDNEISQMAFSIDHFNKNNGTEILFSTLHFATDYLRKPMNKVPETNFDLSSNRSVEAVLEKKKILKKISQIFQEYILLQK